MLKWLNNVGDALSQLGNVLFFNGDPNESISGRSHRQRWKLESWIDAVLGKDHCKLSHSRDIDYAIKFLENNL
jgi:hypothetical protein